MKTSTSTSIGLATAPALRERICAVLSKLSVRTLADGTYAEEVLEMLVAAMPLSWGESDIETWLRGNSEDTYSFFLSSPCKEGNGPVFINFMDYPDHSVEVDYDMAAGAIKANDAIAVLSVIHEMYMANQMPITPPRELYHREDGRPLMQLGMERAYFIRLYQHNASIPIDHLPPFMRPSAMKNQREQYSNSSSMFH